MRAGSKLAAHDPARRRSLLALALIVAGCAVPPPRPADRAEYPARARIAAYALDARLAVRNGEARHSAGLSWQHSADRDLILLSGPLGQGLAELVRDEGGARLTLSDHREFAAEGLDQLAEQVFGVALPLSGMARWVLGDTGYGRVLSSDAAGRPRQVAAEGWTIDFLEWQSPAGEALPTLIDVHRDELGAKLKILEWQEVR